MYFVYLLECSDHTYYCGYTTDLEKRVLAHNTLKSGAEYTKARRPVKLVYSEEFATLSEALIREIAIKKLSRTEKIALIKVR
jgi:putative endonuclease